MAASVGHAVSRADSSLWLVGVGGLSAAGAAAVVADSALGAAALTTVDAGVATTTVHLRLDYLRPIDLASTALESTATVDDHAVDSLLVHGDVSDDAGRLVARASARCLTVVGHGEELEQSAVRGRRVRDTGGEEALAAWTAAGRPLPDGGKPDSVAGPPLATWLSLTTDRDARGNLLVTVPTWPWLANTFGGLMGGAIALIAEQSLTLAAFDAAPPGSAVRPVDLRVLYLRQAVADGRALVCATWVLRRGRRVIDVSADLINADGRLVATAGAACVTKPTTS